MEDIEFVLGLGESSPITEYDSRALKDFERLIRVFYRKDWDDKVDFSGSGVAIQHKSRKIVLTTQKIGDAQDGVTYYRTQVYGLKNGLEEIACVLKSNERAPLYDNMLTWLGLKSTKKITAEEFQAAKRQR